MVEATVRSEVEWCLCRSGQQQGLVSRVTVVVGMRFSDDGVVRVVGVAQAGCGG